MTTVEQGKCYTKSGDKTSFEQNEWHGFSKDGYLSNITVNKPLDDISFHSHWIYNHQVGDIDDKRFPFEGDKYVNFHFNIVKNPSSTSYEYNVEITYNGYDDFCNEIDKFARNNVEALSGHKMNELVEDVSDVNGDGTTYWYTFQSTPIGVATTHYNIIWNTFSENAETYAKTYWLKQTQ